MRTKYTKEVANAKLKGLNDLLIINEESINSIVDNTIKDYYVKHHLNNLINERVKYELIKFQINQDLDQN